MFNCEQAIVRRRFELRTRCKAMDDDDDSESIISLSRSGENNAVGSRVAILKSSKDSGSTSRRDRRRNRRYDKLMRFSLLIFVQLSAKLKSFSFE